ncbi:MAG: hypothetical protein KC731_15785 [Myxococcales bacterium]|nr:hypothetical protein [Myxococcales bacterium]
MSGAAVLALLSFVPLACSSKDDGTTSGTGGSSSSTGGSGGTASEGGFGGTGGDGGAGGEMMTCADQDNAAAVVEAVYVAEDMPMPLGGKIREGTYHLTEQLRYTGPGGMAGPAGAMWHETVIWSATEVRSVLDAYDGMGERRLTFAYDLGAGTGTITMTVICPSPLNVPWTSYTATDTQMTLYAEGVKTAWIYTLQD